MNLDDIGVSTVKDSTAFKKIQFFSKTNPTNLFNIKSDFQNSLNKVNSYYLSDLDLNQSYTYGMDRQHAYTSLNSSLPMSTTLMDTQSFNKFSSYNLGQVTNNQLNPLSINRFDYKTSLPTKVNTGDNLLSYNNNLMSSLNTTSLRDFDFSFFLKTPNNLAILGAENDSKQYSNPLKYALNLKHKKKSLSNLQYVMSDSSLTDSTVHSFNPSTSFSSSTYNTDNTLKFKDYKSSNAQFLGSERTVRLLNNVNSNNYK
jgi:hypothetical protein